MDTNDLRITITVLSLIVFIGICWWAWRPNRASAFKEAAQLPFEEDLPSKQRDGVNHE
ncbi:MAG TPA: cbb3-type cytochrome c oxidase subunit 3 [Burkholderiales bacterium]|jgi:cytochrome c oxidase cbb3-type subunit 4|nr:cbb3-type cytochrome c oxidase subunit 3 [Burkholderiales bacterium]